MVERQGRSGRVQSAGKDAPQNSRGGRVRCAIYTRKSSEEGLEQEFNSLDAQREAAGLTSAARSMRAGRPRRRSMTIPDTLAATWIGQR